MARLKAIVAFVGSMERSFCEVVWFQYLPSSWNIFQHGKSDERSVRGSPRRDKAIMGFSNTVWTVTVCGYHFALRRVAHCATYKPIGI